MILEEGRASILERGRGPVFSPYLLVKVGGGGGGGGRTPPPSHACMVPSLNILSLADTDFHFNWSIKCLLNWLQFQ